MLNALVTVASATTLAVLAGPPALAAPGVWKCFAAPGAPVYQDRPCAPGTELRDFAADPPPLSVVPKEGPPPAPAPRADSRRMDRPSARPRRPEAKVAGDAAERRHVREGMSEGEVLARLGSPDLATKGGRKMRWTFLPAAGDPQTMTLVRFDEGRVVAVERVTVR
ncbi:MAG TPA: hypothetical protein VFX05_18850 [Casimicrobiaceae bacterium]|nr:hypothetical protein [Casimicrobiaceae bacterium]